MNCSSLTFAKINNFLVTVTQTAMNNCRSFEVLMVCKIAATEVCNFVVLVSFCQDKSKTTIGMKHLPFGYRFC